VVFLDTKLLWLLAGIAIRESSNACERVVLMWNRPVEEFSGK